MGIHIMKVVWALYCLELRRRGERPSSNGSKHFRKAIVLCDGHLETSTRAETEW